MLAMDRPAGAACARCGSCLPPCCLLSADHGPLCLQSLTDPLTDPLTHPGPRPLSCSTALQGNAMWENVIGISNDQAGTNQGVEALINAPTVSGWLCTFLADASRVLRCWQRERALVLLHAAAFVVMQALVDAQTESAEAVLC